MAIGAFGADMGISVPDPRNRNGTHIRPDTRTGRGDFTNTRTPFGSVGILNRRFDGDGFSHSEVEAPLSSLRSGVEEVGLLERRKWVCVVETGEDSGSVRFGSVRFGDRFGYLLNQNRTETRSGILHANHTRTHGEYFGYGSGIISVIGSGTHRFGSNCHPYHESLLYFFSLMCTKILFSRENQQQLL
ncbi:hypothetical protein RHGRI_001009 [Rhododendron griersonianum]|uniref:Uncharacterized protein n=1 Tax=Rhododendron griersonianum TaxID=479676 RepID=A0AAV6LM77_9ERIC|nr:hypothetical protein RHGRI_001009 [Rhododendron griersonianum]